MAPIALLATAAAAAGLGGATLPGVAPPAADRPVRVKVSSGQLFEIAERLVRAGSVVSAEAVLTALEQDPSADVRNEARFRQARLFAGQGQNSRASLLLRRILDERPDASRARLELAGLLDRMGDKDGAWRQVRAIRSAGLPPEAARIVDRYSEALRAQRRSGASFEIALAPDSNINAATRSDTLGTVLGDFAIDEAGKAKSGTGLSLHAQAYRRLPLGTNISLLARATGLANLYRHTAFNDLAADMAAGPEFTLGRNRLQVELGATQRWYGQKPFMRSARVAASVQHPVGSRMLVRLSGSAALVDNQRNDLQDGRTFSGQIGVERALSATTGVAGSIGVDRQQLADPGYSTIGWRGGLTAWREIGRMTLTLGAELGRLHADQRLLLFPERRSDRFSRLTVGVTFRQLQFRGFAPLARFSIERNRSDVAFYDYRRTRTELGFVSAF